jgi:hypothetical protein
LIAASVAHECAARSVGLPAVGLDHDAFVAPQKVDLQLGEVEDSLDLGLVDCLGERVPVHDLGRVEQGAGAGGGRDAVDEGDLLGGQVGAVGADAGETSAGAGG